jgi:hypothetical protein
MAGLIGQINRIAALMLMLVSSTFMPVAYANDAGTAKGIARRALPAVVTIDTFDATGRGLMQGSGFIATGDGLVVTNFHVIEGSTSAEVVLQSGERYSVTGVAELDIAKDFAVLKVRGLDLPWLAMGNSDQVEPGDTVVALGAPSQLPGTITSGIFSQTRLENGSRWLQHSAAISRGSSGGPLLTDSGEVIGINTAVRADADGLSFALPINYVRAAIKEATGRLVSLADIDRALTAMREQQKLEATERMLAERFVTYRDPESLFTARLPRAWHVQRNTWTDGDGAYHVVVMAHAAAADTASIRGAMREGIRLHLVFPKKGRQWRPGDSAKWIAHDERAVTATYARHEVVARRAIALAGTQGTRVELASTTIAAASTHAIALHLCHTRGRATIDIALPSPRPRDLDLVAETFENSLAFGWTR